MGHEEGADHVAVARGAEIAGRALATETANLGLATTRELLEEVQARAITAQAMDVAVLRNGPQNIIEALSPETLNYRTVGGE